MQVVQFEGWGVYSSSRAHFGPSTHKWKKAHYFIGHQTLCGLDKQQKLDRFTIISPSNKKNRCKICSLQIQRYGSPHRALQIKTGYNDDNPNVIRRLDWRKPYKNTTTQIHKPIEKKLVPASCAEKDCNESGMAFEPTEGEPKPHYCTKHNLKIKETLKLA